ncbi:hypothetical protein Mp_2g16420 [Marchantia polymorpha subsp. ruderalis]|uniref:Uncharacterized protein n=1 Tax=Marchantia polymorpha TaxID=3197 RepID=A0A2R6W9R9_MARPO|nr:hypothetical protein MARPO_0122s0022 [Marchantia polymorpha]BBN02578.1 hypothetical protein Mp_2g16420 [Marchantia polymorpha subsp. ruderalis]|eukprot:PTQ30591.1 hypothetical protein MARPO_0122s0022 [Marchantia polymorpha]
MTDTLIHVRKTILHSGYFASFNSSSPLFQGKTIWYFESDFCLVTN